jgi:hypothetical protein
MEGEHNISSIAEAIVRSLPVRDRLELLLVVDVPILKVLCSSRDARTFPK